MLALLGCPPGGCLVSFSVSTFSSGSGRSQMLKDYYEALRRSKRRRYLSGCGGGSRERFLSKQTWPCLCLLQGANSSAHSLYLVSREAIHKAYGQEQGMKLEWVFWLPNWRQAGEQRGNTSSKERLTFVPHFQKSEGGPAAALLPLTS